jgi:hypothetical protein
MQIIDPLDMQHQAIILENHQLHDGTPRTLELIRREDNHI